MVSNEESSKIIEEIDPNNPQPISVSVYSQIFEIELSKLYLSQKCIVNIDIYNIKSNKFTKFKYPDGSKFVYSC